MKVLHVYRTYFPDTQGGLEEVIRQICCNTKDVGVESRVFTLSKSPRPPITVREEAQVHRFHRTFEIASCGFSLSALTGFRKLSDWADIIHYHFPWPFADLLHFFTAITKPTIITYHSDIIRQKSLLKLYAPLMRAFLNNVDVIVPTSQNYFATSEELGRFSDKIEIIPIGLSESTYPTPQNQEIVSLKETVGSDFFLFIGVLRYYKGLHILLDALQNTKVKCIIVGAGPIEMTLKQHAAKLGLDNVKFLGYVSDSKKIALLRLCRAVVFPSHLRSEAFGVTLVEGAMHSKPLISTEMGTGTSYINIDGETGFVVPPADSKNLRAAMMRLQNDDSLAIRMGHAARNRYESLFTGSLMAHRYLQLYKKLLHK